MLTGGCYCGLVRYQAEGSASHLVNCHCSICRRTSGAPFVSWFTVPRTAFQFTQGTPTQFKSTEQGLRCFCPDCGTQLSFQHVDTPDEIDLTICSLDNPESLPPEKHIHMESKLSWISLADGLAGTSEANSEE
ncbi:GFA family protein [Solimicrobium silvestre]|uniref:CENP-V/GFA domain-containing protein n=1 Tax=Solimicrobium silvestre TaxID=2099400 RepID=A0A2S9H3K1_9BURK|nr:GFA family protein [Solimicrobium silvestre]PRC94541.1 hypothetical protein S2091_0544 [Solimicrobium silvestre]